MDTPHGADTWVGWIESAIERHLSSDYQDADGQWSLASPEGHEMLAKAIPIALDDYAQPEEIAPLLAFPARSENCFMVGQVPFVYGGTYSAAQRTSHVMHTLRRFYTTNQENLPCLQK